MSVNDIKDNNMYYIMIPAAIRNNSDLSPLSKLIFGEILTLSQSCNYAFANNSYYARIYNVTRRQITRCIKELFNCGYIVISGERKQRKIYIDKKVYIKSNYIDKKVYIDIDKKVYDNKQEIIQKDIKTLFNKVYNKK